ncbi:hypothetical protein SeLEV6574_g02780 [Synchytrium endobioticum]|nr:hypothetical protein SeLEV6574_g02780 [Synchytrium endobioticum]
MNVTGSRSKNSTILVYPANGYMGYMICKEIVHESQRKAQMRNVNEVIAVCCGEGGMYEKLKGMGKPIKTIVMHNADNMSEWKSQMKDRKCDVMMLCMEGAPPHHKKTGMARDESGKEKEHVKKFAESLECAVEMTRHMHCEAVAISTAFAADDSKYKHWLHLYKSFEKAGKKYFKGECGVIFHNMMFDALYLNRDEIMRDGTISWPVAEDAKACPISAVDVARCCMEVMHKMMKGGNKTMAHRHKEYHVTGREKLTPGDMVEMMCDSFDMEIQYNEVDRKEWRKMMDKMQMLSLLDISLMEERFQMMDDGRFKKCTNECHKLIGEKPMDLGEWLDDHRDKFQR